MKNDFRKKLLKEEFLSTVRENAVYIEGKEAQHLYFCKELAKYESNEDGSWKPKSERLPYAEVAKKTGSTTHSLTKLFAERIRATETLNSANTNPVIGEYFGKKIEWIMKVTDLTEEERAAVIAENRKRAGQLQSS